jgi:hypothetical protein
MVKQISVFLENKEGRLAEVVKKIAENGINIRAMSLADTADYGILRFIVDDPERADKVLKDAEFTYSIKEVLAVGIDDKPGGLSKTLDCLTKSGIVIEYMYAFLGKCAGKALVILKVSDINKATDTLKKCGIDVIDGEKLYDL